jgi:hypothetical protein
LLQGSFLHLAEKSLLDEFLFLFPVPIVQWRIAAINKKRE